MKKTKNVTKIKRANNGRPAAAKCEIASGAKAIVVSVLGLRPRANHPAPPFAAIIAKSPKDSLINCSMPCIHVFRASDQQYFDGGFMFEDSDFGFEDGILAVKSENHTVRDGRDGELLWPELHVALKLPVKDWGGLMNHHPNEPPHLRVKTLVEDGYAKGKSPENAQAHGVLALRILQKWNGWNQNKDKLDARALDVMPRASQSQSQLRSAGERLDRLAKAVGLNLTKDTEFAERYNQLLRTLRVAALVNSELRKRT